MGHLLSGSFAGRLYPKVVMVVLSTPAVAELFVFARLTALAFRHRRCVGDDVATILAAGQVACGSYKPKKLKVYSSKQIANPPSACQLIRG
jgi:hypothetical protein